MEIFRLLLDANYPKRWSLSNIEGTIAADFYDDEKCLKFSNLAIPVYQDGVSLDFSFSNLGIPIVSETFKNLFMHFKDVSFLPITIKSPGYNGNYFVLLANRRINCLNEKLSLIQRYTDEDDLTFRKIGDIKYVYRCVLNSNEIPPDASFFRLTGWNTFQLVTNSVKEIIEKNNLTGASFTPIDTVNEGGRV